VALENKDYQQRLNAVHVKNAADQKRLAAIAIVTQQDEKWKADNCKLCPHCRRVINKLDGCDSMICGKNYHGGDVQDGCGQQFSYSTAPAYQPSVDVRPFMPVPAPKRSATRIWREDNGEATTCSVCSKAVEGIKLQCINCPYLVCCINCELLDASDMQAVSPHHSNLHLMQIFR